MIYNENEDNRMSRFKPFKDQLRLKIKRCLYMFRYIIILAETMKFKATNQAVNITQSTLFKELLFHFNE